MSKIKRQFSNWWGAYCFAILIILCIINYFTLETSTIDLSRVIIDGKCNAVFTITNNTDNKIAVELNLKGFRQSSTGRAGGQSAMGTGSYILNPEEILDIKESLTCTGLVGSIIGDAEIVSIKTL